LFCLAASSAAGANMTSLLSQKLFDWSVCTFRFLSVLCSQIRALFKYNI